MLLAGTARIAFSQPHDMNKPENSVFSMGKLEFRFSAVKSIKVLLKKPFWSVLSLRVSVNILASGYTNKIKY